MVLRPEKEADGQGGDLRQMGSRFRHRRRNDIAEDRFEVLNNNGTVKADLPLKALSGTAPEYDRPWEPTGGPAAPC